MLQFASNKSPKSLKPGRKKIPIRQPGTGSAGHCPARVLESWFSSISGVIEKALSGEARTLAARCKDLVPAMRTG